MGLNKQRHLLTEQGNLQLLAWTVSEKDYMQREFHMNLPLLSRVLKDKRQTVITNRPGISGTDGGLREVDLIGVL